MPKSGAWRPRLRRRPGTVPSCRMMHLGAAKVQPWAIARGQVARGQQCRQEAGAMRERTMVLETESFPVERTMSIGLNSVRQ